VSATTRSAERLLLGRARGSCLQRLCCAKWDLTNEAGRPQRQCTYSSPAAHHGFAETRKSLEAQKWQENKTITGRRRAILYARSARARRTESLRHNPTKTTRFGPENAPKTSWTIINTSSQTNPLAAERIGTACVTTNPTRESAKIQERPTRLASETCFVSGCSQRLKSDPPGQTASNENPTLCVFAFLRQNTHPRKSLVNESTPRSTQKSVHGNPSANPALGRLAWEVGLPAARGGAHQQRIPRRQRSCETRSRPRSLT